MGPGDEDCEVYGSNHYRFHSWCPPEAAFEAADELGIYIQAELPNKRDFGTPEHDDYLRLEGERIFRAFGNHPSFVMFTLGNELGRNQAYFDMVDHFKKIDPRRLYAQGTNNENYPGSDLSLASGDDFWVTSKTGLSLPVRGSFFQGDFAEPHIEHRSPSTMVDFSESIAGIPVPVVGHEIGSFQVFPDFTEIPKYTGVLRARNYEIFRDRLAAKHMLDQANDFVRASGGPGGSLLPRRHRSGPAYSRFRGVSVARSSGLPGPGDRSCRDPECLHGIKRADNTERLAGVLL